MALSYDASTCDLCNSSAHEAIACIGANRGMTSDSRVVLRSLKTVRCTQCGLVRDGAVFEARDLEDHYKNAYQLNTTKSGEEHTFFTPSGMIPRSQVIHDWILQIKPEFSGQILEIGCGQGSLLRRLAATFPGASFSGIDLNALAVGRAQQQGLNVNLGASSDISGKYDAIIAFGVLEHVPSPSRFLAEIQKALTDGGEVIVGQPMQDVSSYDLFFVDHLHHFTTQHVRALGQKAGLYQENALLGCQFVSNFSLHRFRKSAVEEQSFSFVDPPSVASVKRYFDFFAEINRYLKQRPKTAVFGAGEVFSLLYAYTDLATANIVCGLDDNPDRQMQNHWPFPVVSPENASSYSISNVLLCVNPRYNEMVSKRLRALGFKPTAILTES